MRNEGASSGDSLLSMGLVWALCLLLVLSLLMALLILCIWLAKRRRKCCEKHHSARRDLVRHNGRIRFSAERLAHG